MLLVATAGHVDHGKSSLVRMLTGTDPDRFAEEQRRGMTIDLGFAHTTLPTGTEVSFVDVPGHVRFIRNMLAGVGAVDACVLVVAATEGWKPQSEEHLRILDLLGVRHGIVVLTMSDLVDDEWLQLQQLEVEERLAGSFLDGAEMVACSSVTRAGIADVHAALQRLAEATPTPPDRGRPRLWVDRSFAAKGSGTIVTGTLTGGSLRTDQGVDIAGHHVRVRAVQTHGAPVDEQRPGTRVALNLVGIAHHQLERGDAVVVASQWRPTRMVDASLRVLDSVDHDVSRRGAHVAYIGSGELPVRLRVLGHAALKPGTSGLVRLHLPKEMPLLPGDRYVLRESGRAETVGGGEVLDIDPVLPASRANPDRDVARVVRERGPVDATELLALTGERIAPTAGQWVIDPDRQAAMAADLTRRLDDGIDLTRLTEPERAVLGTLVDVDIRDGVARRAGSTDALAAHPFVHALAVGGAHPPDPDGVPRNEIRELVRRGLVIERDGICFHPATIDAAAALAARLLSDDPGGFTTAQFREAIGTTRKYVIPLLTELDARGITRRREELRIAGPRLPSGGARS